MRGAVAFAGAFTCATDEATLEAASSTFVRATAQAIAKAVIEIDQFCLSTERAGFCSLIEGSITAFAKAQAEAFAEAWAGTAFDCPCEVSATDISTSVVDVFAQATAEVSRTMCQFGAAPPRAAACGQSATIALRSALRSCCITCCAGEAFEYTSEQITKVVENQATALASAFAAVKSNGKNCQATVGVDTGTSDDPDATLPPAAPTVTETICANCVGAHEVCWIRGNDVLGCCDEAFECIQRSPSRAACKKPESPAATRFADFGYGQTLECPKD